MKVGDTVRFLNDIGGGKITRVEGRVVYVEDSDGFEQPMLQSECVLVPTAQPENTREKEVKQVFVPEKEDKPQPKPRQTASGFSIALIFEPHDIRHLSQTAFDIYLVNDTNYTLQFSIATRDRLDSEWQLLAADEVAPCTQAFLDEVYNTDLNRFENISVQAIARKSDETFELQPPVAMQLRFDVTRLAKLHCFTSTAYSSEPVLTIPVITNGKVNSPLKTAELLDHFEPKPEPPTSQQRKTSMPSAKKALETPDVVDLHASELLDSTAGLSASDILAYQLKIFEQHMRDAEKTPGKRIVFIHGKGEGVLRHAILDRLRRRWPRCEAQDASFREYGFGATQITIHK